MLGGLGAQRPQRRTCGLHRRLRHEVADEAGHGYGFVQRIVTGTATPEVVVVAP